MTHHLSQQGCCEDRQNSHAATGLLFDDRRHSLDLVSQGNPVAQVAKDQGISESCLRRWMEREDVDAGGKVGLTGSRTVEPQDPAILHDVT